DDRARSNGTSAVRGELERRQLAQALAPVVESGLQTCDPKSFALPCCIIAVAHRQRQQRRYLSGSESSVKRTQLRREHSDRPTIGDDVMERDNQNVFELAAAQQPRAKERPAPQVERPHCRL